MEGDLQEGTEVVTNVTIGAVRQAAPPRRQTRFPGSTVDVVDSAAAASRGEAAAAEADEVNSARHLRSRSHQDLRRGRSEGPRASRGHARHRAGRVRRRNRAIGLRQIHTDAHSRLPRSSNHRPVFSGWPRRSQAEPERAGRGAQPENRLRVSRLQSSCADVGAGQRRTAAALHASVDEDRRAPSARHGGA